MFGFEILVAAVDFPSEHKNFNGVFIIFLMDL